jgi:phosphatidate cytidylyltransferase
MSSQAVPVRHLKFNTDWITRPVFGIGLAALAISALVAGRWYFAAFVGVGVIGAAWEWHRMVEHRRFAREFWISASAIAISLTVLTSMPQALAAWLVLATGAALVFGSARLRGSLPIWHAAGLLYIGVPALLLIALRATGVHGAWIIAGFLVVVWATDTGALIAGKLIGGPKFWPRLSPNKTWSGTLGGVAVAVAVGVVYVAFLGGSMASAALYALAISAIAHAGDLGESAIKRIFSVKDSGSIIPGHGGILDRIDSTLAVSAVVGMCVLGAGLDPMFGARP